MTPATPRYWRANGVLRIASCAAAVLLCGSSFADRPPAGVAHLDNDAPRSTFSVLFSAPLPALGPDDAQAAITDRAAWGEYTLAAVRDDGAAVPRLFLAHVPADLPRLDSPEARKNAFVKMLLPLILAENERILAERKHLLALGDGVAAGGSLRRVDQSWLEEMADRYEVPYDPADPAAVIARLERRVDIVPPSLAIGQAALETGWGTSAAARGQAMFGQMVFSDDGERAEVRRFERLAHAVRAYEHNLNTHHAYERFRARRAFARERQVPLNGYELALTLIRYSERKMDYVRDVRGIIKANKLQPLDAARLDDGPQLAGG
jgi:Bax protein